MIAREAILVDLQGVRAEAMLEASSMSEERGERPRLGVGGSLLFFARISA